MDNEKTKVMCEVSLDGVVCPKRAMVPQDIHKSDPRMEQIIREYFQSLGYVNVGSVKVL